MQVSHAHGFPCSSVESGTARLKASSPSSSALQVRLPPPRGCTGLSPRPWGRVSPISQLEVAGRLQGIVEYVCPKSTRTGDTCQHMIGTRHCGLGVWCRHHSSSSRPWAPGLRKRVWHVEFLLLHS